MDFGFMALNTFPSLLRHSPFNGGERFSPPSKHLRHTTERGGERINFFQMPHLHVLLTGRGTYNSPNFESSQLLISCSSEI